MYRNSAVILGLLLLSACNMQQGSPAAGPSATISTTPTTPPNPQLDRQIEAYDEAIRLSNDPVTKARAMLNKGNVQGAGLRPAAAIATYDTLIKTWGTHTNIEVRRIVAAAMLNMGQSHKAMKQFIAEVVTYDLLIERFGSADDLAIRRHVAATRTFLAEAHRRDRQPQRAAAMLPQLRSRGCADLDELIQYNCARALRTIAGLRQDLHQYEDAVELYGEVIREYGNRLGTRTPPEVIEARAQQASILSVHLKRPKDAQAAYEAVLAIPHPPTDARSKFNRGMSLVNLAAIQSNGGQRDDAVKRLDQAISEFEKDATPSGIYIAGRAMVNRGIILQGTGRAPQALSLFDTAIARLEPQKLPVFEEVRVAAFIGRSQALLRMHRFDDAITAYDAVISRFGNSTNLTIRESAAKIALAKAEVLKLQSARAQLQDLTKSLDDKIAQEEAKPEPQRSEGIAAFTLAKGALLGVVGFYDEATAMFDTIIARYGNATSPALRQTTASAYYSKALVLHGRGTSFEAATTMRELIARYGGASEAGIQRTVQQAQQWLEANRQFDAVG